MPTRSKNVAGVLGALLMWTGLLGCGHTTSKHPSSSASPDGTGCEAWQPGDASWSSVPSSRPANMWNWGLSASGQYLYATGQWLEAGVPHGGLLRSSDLGATWCVASALSNSGPVIVPSPADDDYLYGTELSDDQATQLIRTTDGGATWSHAELPLAPSFALVPSAADPDIVLLTTQVGSPWLSRDGGGSWTELELPAELQHTPRAVLTAVDRTDPERITLMNYANSRVYSTADAGDSWQISDPFGTNPIVAAASMLASPDGYLYAWYAGTLLVSPDWGGSWTTHPLPDALASPIPLSRGTALFVASTSELWRSLDHGESFELVPKLSTYLEPLLSLGDAGVLARDSFGSLVVTDDAGQTWSVPPPVPMPQALRQSPVKPWPLWSTSPPAFSDDGGVSWSRTTDGFIIPGGSAPGVAFRFGDGPELVRTDNGVDWKAAKTPDDVAQIHGVASCAAPLRCVYLLYSKNGGPLEGSALASHLARSDDEGLTWSNTFAVPAGVFYEPNVMEVWPDDADHVVVSGGAGLMQTRDGGRTFNAVDLPGFTGTASIALFAGGVGLVSGSNLGMNGGVVFRTTDAGKTWNELDTGLGTLFVSHAHEGTLFLVGGDVLRSDDRGATWTRITPGAQPSSAAPSLIVTSIADAPGGSFLASESYYGLVRFE